MTIDTEVNLWFWRPDGTVRDIARWRKHLAPDELERMSRFMFPEDQTRYITCRSRMRRILGWYLGLSPKDVVFAVTGRSKPIIADRTVDISFNLSHTDGLACLAVTRGGAVGVDLECVREIKDEFIAYALNPNEHAAVIGHPVDARQLAFFRYWTAKEAYLKAMGTGLWQSLKTFDVQVPTSTAPGEFRRGTVSRIDDAEQRKQNWHLYTFRATPKHIGALALTPKACGDVRICSHWIGASPWV